jgi:hypothetical protein
MEKSSVLFKGTAIYKSSKESDNLSVLISAINEVAFYTDQIDEIKFDKEGFDIYAELELTKCELNNLKAFFFCIGDANYEFLN